MRVIHGQGLSLDFNSLNIGLDSQSSNSDLIFISHAHTDHLISKTKTPVLTSRLTADLMTLRTKHEHYFIHDFLDIKMIDSGHVLGGKALIVKGDTKLLYTGDFTTYDRFFLKGLKPVKCDDLIIETTYGLPEYDLPKPADTINRARDVITDDLANGHSVVLLGYALGKSQIISKLVENFNDVYSSKDVSDISSVCKNHGFDVPVFGELPKDKNNFIYLTTNKKRLDTHKSRVYSFTGWGAKGVTDCFPLSDHAGFKELLWFVKNCKPERVYTHHGFSEEFASLLRVEGINAKAL